MFPPYEKLSFVKLMLAAATKGVTNA